jgi:hypothetical protein
VNITKYPGITQLAGLSASTAPTFSVIKEMAGGCEEGLAGVATILCISIPRPDMLPDTRLSSTIRLMAMF